MALEQKLSLKLGQRLVMTPSLQQAIKLLQMTRFELEGVLSQELEENPLLEPLEDEPVEADGETAEETKDDDQAMDDIDLDAYFNEYLESGYERQSGGTYEPREAVPIEATLAEEEDLYDHLLWQLHMMDLAPERRELCELIIGNLDEDGFLVASVEEIQILGASDEEVEAYRRRLDEALAGSGAETPAATSEDAEPAGSAVDEDGVVPIFEAEPGSEEERLLADAGAVVGEAGPEQPEADSGEAEAKDPSTVTASDLVSRAQDEHLEVPVPGYPRDEVEEAIRVVQSLDPAGVGCRTLRESLLFQLREAGEEDSLTYRLVDEYWDLCLKRQFAAIAKDMGLPLQELKEPSEHIRHLDTRPGRRYGGERTQYVEPDVHVVNVGGEFVVQINDDGLPRLRVNKAYRRMLREMKQEGRDSNAQQYIREKMRSAMWLIKSLDQRQRTIYKVAESIVKQQREFFEKGIEYLRPMVLRDVADDIEMHESTVSRVVSNKYIHTPRGLYPMKFFFHSGIDRDMGGDISSLTVKRKIKNLIEAENPKKPLSDSALMKRLKAEGIQIARRTVAKYRDEMQIPSSTDRKQVF